MPSLWMDGRARRASISLLLLLRFAAPPFRGPLLAAAAGLALAAATDMHAYLPLFCGRAAEHLSLSRIAVTLKLLLAINRPINLALAWLAMLVAMMTPLTALPLAHVRASTLVARRSRAAAGFLLGYFGIWGLAGVPLSVIAFLLELSAGSAFAAFVCASLLALAWSASPLQQAAQNRAHRLRRLGLFGLAADRDCIVFGAALGGWCLASCWAWMLVPLFVPYGHALAMTAVSAILMAERLRRPGPLRWRAPVLLSTVLRGWSRSRLPLSWRRSRA